MPIKPPRKYDSIGTKQELIDEFNCPVYDSWTTVPKGLFTREKLGYLKIIIKPNTPPDGIVMNLKFGSFKRLYKVPKS